MPGASAPFATVDGFRLGECVHSGAQARIFRVVGPATVFFPIVMKVPRLGADEPSENLISFETEVSILPALSGPHVPRFVAAGDLAKTPYLVIEWIEGETVDSMLKRGAVPPADVARVGAAIADAVHAVHLQDAIHLDIKPDNLVVKTNGSVALIDFGLAHHARYPDLLAEEKRFAAGSAPYVSPEQVLGTRSDTRSDIFALGVVLYEMATGKLPFGTPRPWRGCATGCGSIRSRRASAHPICRRGCRRSSCVASSLARTIAISPPRTSPSTCAIPIRSASPSVRSSRAERRSVDRFCAGGAHAASRRFSP